jgi:hypothetical protein
MSPQMKHNHRQYSGVRLSPYPLTLFHTRLQPDIALVMRKRIGDRSTTALNSHIKLVILIGHFGGLQDRSDARPSMYCIASARVCIKLHTGTRSVLLLLLLPCSSERLQRATFWLLLQSSERLVDSTKSHRRGQGCFRDSQLEGAPFLASEVIGTHQRPAGQHLLVTADAAHHALIAAAQHQADQNWARQQMHWAEYRHHYLFPAVVHYALYIILASCWLCGGNNADVAGGKNDEATGIRWL